MNDDFEIREPSAPLPDPEAELKAIRKNLRRRNLKIVLTSVVLVLAILAAAVKVAVPALERRYWDPTVCTYLEDVSDLELTMATYNALFGHGKYLLSVDIQKQGFADYSVNAVFAEQKTIYAQGDLSYRFASVTKGELLCPPNFWLDEIPGIFVRSFTPKTTQKNRSENRRARARLGALPDYIQVYASVTFPEDKSMEDLLQLTYQDPPGETLFTWAILRSCDASDDPTYPCGIPLTGTLAQSARYSPHAWNNTEYRKLFVEPYNNSGTDLEQHVKSMLKFSADQLQKGEGILPPGADPDYYTKTLAYMEENGVKAYGCYVIARPETLLNMMDEGMSVRLLDARIGL